MNDKWISCLDKYDLDIIKAGKTKGSILVESTSGYYLLKELKESVRQLEFEEILLNKINGEGEILVDYIIRTSDGELITQDSDGIKYILKRWYLTKECEVQNPENLLKASKSLGKLHIAMRNINNGVSTSKEESKIRLISKEYEKHNIEMKRARTFIRNKHMKNEFELLLLGNFEEFYYAGCQVKNESEKDIYNDFAVNAAKNNEVIHGAYNYHNVMFTNEMAMIINFEHAKYDVQIKDLYDFLRKVMEKHRWNYDLGNKILSYYDTVKPITNDEMKYLKMCLSYPEKFWKIVNHYYNNNKAWIPDKDIEKLKLVISQNKEKNIFINRL